MKVRLSRRRVKVMFTVRKPEKLSLWPESTEPSSLRPRVSAAACLVALAIDCSSGERPEVLGFSDFGELLHANTTKTRAAIRDSDKTLLFVFIVLLHFACATCRPTSKPSSYSKDCPSRW